ncbi:MAG: hypothetical protein J7M40_14240, partial [Planctomycetes bacterium]|nr:hypothetical protein [Planctomycetota bacterium]
LKMGGKPDEERIRNDALGKLKKREDAADFRLPAILNILHKYSESDLLSESFVADAKETILNFKYWPDELEGWSWTKTARMDSAYIYKLLHDDDKTNDADAVACQAEFDRVDAMDDMCYWSENHFILFSSGAYLAAQLYPSETFTASVETGAQRMVKFKPRVMRWLELRYKSGFSEWLSNVYYNEDMPAVLALIELCEDREIQQLATMVMDLMAADMALNSFHGSFGSTHGRTYENKMSGLRDHTRPAFDLMFDTNDPDVGNMSASLLAASEKYRLPHVIYEIAADTRRAEFVNKQRMGITIDKNTFGNWGLDTRSVENGGCLENAMTFLTLEAYTHPLTIELFRDMLDTYSMWGNKFFAPFKESRLLIEHPELFDTVFDTTTGINTLSKIASLAEKDIARNMRPEVNIYTYRTPYYMLSTAQDWRAGFGGDQQSIWQATLGMEAVCFTTHPAKQGSDSQSTPNYWTGYGTLPRAIQVEDVVISLYDIDTTTDIYLKDQPLYTHAYLPRGKFDKSVRQVADNGVWFFARKGDAYLALFSSDKDADWIANDDDKKKKGKYEIVANGEKTVWICQLGSRNEYANFDAFTKAIVNAPLAVDAAAMTVAFQSPSQGSLVMDWENDLTRNGASVNVSDYKRYENPYSSAEFPADIIAFKFNGNSLILDFKNKTRKVTNACDSGASRAH